MTRLLSLSAPVVLALLVAGFLGQARGEAPRPPRLVVVVDESAGRAPAAVGAATAAVRSARAADVDAELRVTHSPTEQRSVTSYFAARGYDIVGVGLYRAIAVDPVAERHPSTGFALTDARGIPSAVAAVR